MQLFYVNGNTQKLDGGAMFGNAPKELWTRWVEPDDKNRIRLSCRCFLLKTDSGQNILFEAGIGAFFSPELADRYGVEQSGQHRLVENLKSLGVDPQDIDLVVLSHLHFDHCGGILKQRELLTDPASKNNLVFTNAYYLVSESAYQRALNPHKRDRASFIKETIVAIEDSGKIIRRTAVNDYKGSRAKEFSEKFKDLLSRLEFILSDGHTPGQMLSLLTLGEKQKYFFSGDLFPGIPWLRPALTMGYDRYAELVIDEKMVVLKRAELEGWKLLFTHDALVSSSQVQTNSKGGTESALETRGTESFGLLYEKN